MGLPFLPSGPWPAPLSRANRIWDTKTQDSSQYPLRLRRPGSGKMVMGCPVSLHILQPPTNFQPERPLR